MTDFISVCHRHRFESEIFPEAQAQGWPQKIKWHAVARRIEKMRPVLQALLVDGDEFSRPRARCIFWQELLEQLKKQGSRALTSVRGQFANFQKIQPG